MRLSNFNPSVKTLHDLKQLTGGTPVLTVNSEIFLRFFVDVAPINVDDFATTVDSRLIYWILNYLYGRKVQLITGADVLKDKVFGDVPFKILIIGGEEDFNKLAVNRINSQGKSQVISKSYNIKNNGMFAANDEELQFDKLCGQTKFDYVFVCLGSPKQECFISHKRIELAQTGANFVVGAGASWDFLSQRKTRAPSFVNSIGLEWLFRALSTRGHYRRMIKAFSIFLYV
tara:strand:- start:557 stop:1246 length:690 start_codon:yes stop_codon:yes gene_type:complete